MKKKVIDLYKFYKDSNDTEGFVLPPAESIDYPVIDGNESNFLEDYNDAFTFFDRYFVNDFGARTYHSIFDPETEDEVLQMWRDDILAILHVYINSWARLYYALNIDYNPLYNVDGTTKITYSSQENSDVMGGRLESDVIGSKDRSDIMGARSETESIGSKETTNGARSDTSTNYAVSYDATLEKETGKTADQIGQQITTEGAQSNGRTAQTYTDRHTEESHTDTHTAQTYTDTHNYGAHTETTERYGNQGVTMTQQMLEAEFEARKRTFFHEVFVILSHELGLYYE